MVSVKTNFATAVTLIKTTSVYSSLGSLLMVVIFMRNSSWWDISFPELHEPQGTEKRASDEGHADSHSKAWGGTGPFTRISWTKASRLATEEFREQGK